MKYEAGVTQITPPYAPRWTGEFIEAESENAALDYFSSRGYYRNLVVRECPIVYNWPYGGPHQTK